MYYWQFKNGKLSEKLDVIKVAHLLANYPQHYAAWDYQLGAWVLYAAN